MSTDVGYAWIVCSAACMVHFVVCGIQNGYGVLYIYIMKELGAEDKATSAWVGSINYGVEFLLSPLVTWACDRWGCRLTGIIGAIAGAVGLAASSFIRDIYLLYLTYGIVLGIGCGLCYITTFKVLSCWFYRRIAFANSVCFAGDSLGSLVMAPALQRMLSTFGLSWTFRSLAGMFLITSLMAAMYRTTPVTEKKGKDTAITDGSTKDDYFKLLRNGPFVTLMIGCLAFPIACTMTNAHVPMYAKETGILETPATMLISVTFPCRLLSAIFFGKVVDHFPGNRLVFYQLGLLGIGLVQTFLTIARSFPSFLALMVFHGVCSGILYPLQPVLVVDMIGKRRASQGLGIYFGLLAIPYFTGSPLAGWIYDLSRSYELSFLASGAFCVSSCCILFIVPLFKQKDKRKSFTKSNKTNNCKLIGAQNLHKYHTDDSLSSWRSFKDYNSYCVPGWMNLHQQAIETNV